MSGKFSKQFWTDLAAFTKEYWFEVAVLIVFITLILAAGIYLF